MNTINITPAQISQAIELDGNANSLFLPATINGINWTLRFDNAGYLCEMTETEIAKQLENIHMALHVNGGTLEGLSQHIALNTELKFIGGIETAEFLANLSEYSEINKELFI